MKLEPQTYREIDGAMADIQALSSAGGQSRETLDAIRERLMQLAKRTDLFNLEVLPPPQPSDKAINFMYRLYEDEGGLTLYANSASGRFFETPVHNHKTWAVLAGVDGSELNKMYERTEDGGIREIGQEALRQGTGLAYNGEELHCIRIEAPLLNFHLYGVGLERQKARQYYDSEKKEWIYFEAHPDIIEAREKHAG